MLAPHRAVYDLALGRARDASQIAAVRGRILYDFDGNACEGYSLKFRQVSELDCGEGKVSTSDLRSTTWEGGDAKSFKFTSENFLDQNLVDSVDGNAEHGTGATAIKLAKPEHKALDIDAGVVFPTQQMVRVIEAARAGKSILDFPVYDGSETGEKVYNTLTVIGHKIAPDEHKHADAAAEEPKLAGVPRWPVTISYFDKAKARRTASRRRFMRSASSFTKTASRARCPSTTTISSSPRNLPRWRSRSRSRVRENVLRVNSTALVEGHLSARLGEGADPVGPLWIPASAGMSGASQSSDRG